MKKIAMILIAMCCALIANAQQDIASVPGDNYSVIASVSSDNQTTTTITFYNNSTKSLKVCVSVYKDERGGKVGQDCYDVPAAPAQGYHSETTVTLTKIGGCHATTSGCEVKRIKITSVKVKK